MTERAGRDWTDWEIIKTASGSYLGKVTGTGPQGSLIVNPCFEYHSQLMQRQAGPNQIQHVRMKMVQAIESSGTIDAQVFLGQWNFRLRVEEMDKEDRRELDKLLEKAEAMAKQAHSRVAQPAPPPSILLRS